MDAGSKEQNYWPGFVDALANVVLTLVFVLVVFVFALVMATNKVHQQVLALNQVAEQRQQQKKDAEQEMLDLRRELREALASLQEARTENAELKRQIEQLKRQTVPGAEELNALKEKVQIKIDAPPREQTDPNLTDVDRGTGAIIITFPRGVFELNDNAKAELAKALDAQRAQIAGLTAGVKSITGVETFSEGRRLAYFRGLTVRNFLIDHGLGTGRTIKMTIDQAKDVGDGRVEIRFHRQ